MPQGKHSAIQGELVSAINRLVKPERVARAFPELCCNFGDRPTVPDIAVFTWSQIPRDENQGRQIEFEKPITSLPFERCFLGANPAFNTFRFFSGTMKQP